MFYSVGYFIGCISLLGMGVFVLWFKPRNPEARLWALLSLLFALASTPLAAAAQGEQTAPVARSKPVVDHAQAHKRLAPRAHQPHAGHATAAKQHEHDKR